LIGTTLSDKGVAMVNCPKSNCSDKSAMTEAMNLAEKMLKIADNGFRNCEDDSCIYIFGLIRDYGYKIRRTVEQEQFADQKRDGCIKAFH
jgi:hypothetical protein